MINIAVNELKSYLKKRIKGKIHLTYFKNSDTLLVSITPPVLYMEYRYIVKDLTNYLWLGSDLSTLSTHIVDNYKNYIKVNFFK